MALLYYRARIRNAANSADDLVVTSLGPSGTNPYMAAPPTGDGGSLDILTGTIQQGALQVLIVDAVTSGPAYRLVTSILADATAQQQLLSRVTYIEESADGSVWTPYFVGYLRRLRLVSAMKWELTVGDVTAAESVYIAFATSTTTFPKVVNIVGELIPGGWGPVASIGQTTFKVTLLTAKRVRLRYQYGPLPPDYVYKNQGNTEHYRFAALLARPFAVKSDQWANEDTGVRAYFPRLVARVRNTTTGATIGSFTPIGHSTTGQNMIDPQGFWGWDEKMMMNLVGELWLDWPAAGGPVAQPALNSIVAVQVQPLDVSTLNPMHVEGHPVDIWTGLYTEAGIPWSAAAAATLKDQLGQTLRFRGRFTGGVPLGELMAKTFGGPLGIGVRVAADGSRELISVRDLPTSIPGTTVTVNDLRSSDGVIFDLDDASVVNRVTWATEGYEIWDKDRDGGARPNDLIAVAPTVYATENGDAGALRGKEHKYGIQGHFYDSRGAGAYSPIPFFAAQASRVFDRFGRGGVRGEVRVLRGTTPLLGSFICLDLPHLPVAIGGAVPVSQRGQGLRVVQVERVRPSPDGPILSVLDAGRNAQPSVSPTITVAASARDPKHYAEVTVTNVAALQASGTELVRFQMGTGVGAPTGGIEFAKRGVFELVANNVVPLPPVAAGEKVWVRAQSKDTQLLLPSAWTAWASVTLTPLTAPSALSLVAGANDTEKVVRWSLADTESSVRIRWKLTGDFDWERTVYLPPGTVEYTITDLIPGGGGISGEVAVVDILPSPGESTATAFSFTPGVVSPTLPVPWSPAGWVGSQDDLSVGPGQVDGSFGLDVTAAKWPCTVEVEVAVETAVGSGVYGAYLTMANPLVFQGYRARTRFTFWAPNDRLRRKLRARHVQPGYTSSAYTAESVVSPWVAQKAIIPAVDNPTFGVSAQAGGTYENPQAYILVKYDLPPNPHFDYVRYRVRQREIDATTWGPDTFVVGGRDGDDFVPVQFSVEAEIRLDAVNTDGVINETGTPVVVRTPTYPLAVLQSATGVAGALYQTTHVGREPARLNFPFITDAQTVRVEFYSEEHTTDPGAPRDLADGRAPELSVPVVPVNPGPTYSGGAIYQKNSYCISLPLAASGNYRLVTIVPISRVGRPGVKVHLKAQGDATALPAPPDAAINTGTPSAGQIAKVSVGAGNSGMQVENQINTSGAGLPIRAYRNGQLDVQVGDIFIGPNYQMLLHWTVSQQQDVWEYCHYSGPVTAPRESARTPKFTSVSNLYVLAAPAIPTGSGGTGLFAASKVAGSLVVTEGGWHRANPVGPGQISHGGVRTVGILCRAPDVAGVPGAWTEVAELAPLQNGFVYDPGAGTWHFSIIFRCDKWTDSARSNVVGPITFP